jgi:hypothetical protein
MVIFHSYVTRGYLIGSDRQTLCLSLQESLQNVPYSIALVSWLCQKWWETSMLATLGGKRIFSTTGVWDLTLILDQFILPSGYLT